MTPGQVADLWAMKLEINEARNGKKMGRRVQKS